MQTRRGSVVQRCVYAELECLGERRRLGGEERAKKGGDLPGESLDEREEGRGGDAGDVDEKLAAIAVEEEGVAERHGGPGGGLHAQREGAEGVLLGADPGAVDGRRAVEGGEPGLPVSEGKRGNVEAVGGEEEQRVGGEGRRGGRGGRGMEGEEAEKVGAERTAMEGTEVDEVRGAVAKHQHDLLHVQRGMEGVRVVEIVEGIEIVEFRGRTH